MRIVACLVLLFAACGAEERFVPNFDEERSLPGPTAAGNQYGREYAFEYDDESRLISMGYPQANEHGGPQLEGTSWTYADQKLSSVVRSYVGQISGTDYTSWRFSALSVDVSLSSHSPSGGNVVRSYDPAMFAFLPLVGLGVFQPSAELGLLRSVDSISGDETTYTWTADGTTRTRLSSTGLTSRFTLDDRGRILRIEDVGRVRTFEYEGDLLVRASDTEGIDVEYAYDRGGNLVQMDDHRAARPRDNVGEYTETTVFVYDGW